MSPRTRRILNAYPNRAAILVQDPENGRWLNLGIADRSYASIVRRIIGFGPEWRTARGREHRIQFFLTLFGHSDRAIYELAYLEMARAPYGTIRKLGRTVSRQQLEPMLKQRVYIKWRSALMV